MFGCGWEGREKGVVTTPGGLDGSAPASTRILWTYQAILIVSSGCKPADLIILGVPGTIAYTCIICIYIYIYIYMYNVYVYPRGNDCNGVSRGVDSVIGNVIAK